MSRARVRVHDSWRHLVEREVAKPYFADLKRFLRSEEHGAKEVFPPRHTVFGALDACPLQDVRVVEAVLGRFQAWVLDLMAWLAYVQLHAIQRP